MSRFVVAAVLSLSTGVAGNAAAQRQPGPEPAGVQSSSITIAGKIGKKSFHGSGKGTCRHAPAASIEGIAASLWTVQYANPREAGVKQLSLTLWRPKDGDSDRLSLSLETSSGSHRIETGPEANGAGEGSVTILPSGPGGRLEISGKEAAGKRLQLTIDCPLFAPVEAEGG